MPAEIGSKLVATLETFIAGINSFRILFLDHAAQRRKRVYLRCKSRTGGHMGVPLDSTLLLAYQSFGDSLNIQKSEVRCRYRGHTQYHPNNGASNCFTESRADTQEVHSEIRNKFGKSTKTYRDHVHCKPQPCSCCER